MSSMIRGTPPPAATKRIMVYRVTTCETQQFVSLSVAPFGQPVHWFGRRSHECSAERGACKGCSDNWPTKWKGYIHVSCDAGRTTAFLEITATCYHLLESRIPKGTSWRGVQFRIGRTKGGAKGRYLVEVLERVIDANSLPEELDPLPTLRMLWRSKKGPGHSEQQAL